MKTKIKIFSMLLCISFICSCSPKVDESRTKVLKPYKNGPFAVGSSTLVVDKKKLAARKFGASAYNAGKKLKDGTMFYMTDILANSSSTLSFELEVPKESKLLAPLVGKKIPYVGIMFYPTSKKNNDPDKQLELFGDTLPKMVKSGSRPKFSPKQKKYPLVIYSHGHGQHPFYRLVYLKQLASHGYVVFSLYHADYRFASFKEDNYTQRQHMRALSIKKALDYLKKNKRYNKYIDFDNIGMLGVHMGATTTAMIAGGKFFSNDKLYNYTDSRIKTAVVVAPYFGSDKFPYWGNDHEGIKNIKIPFFTIVGEDDDFDQIADYPTTLDVMKVMTSPKMMVRLADAGHEIKLPMQTISDTLSIIHFDAFLKNDKKAKDLLSNVKKVDVKQEMDFLLL